MKKGRKNLRNRSFEEVYASVRRDWGNVKPVTRVIENGKKQSRNELKKALRKESLEG